ncbi:MAG: hypothetical protein AB1297_02130 [bacterium]
MNKGDIVKMKDKDWCTGDWCSGALFQDLMNKGLRLGGMHKAERS